MQAFPNDQPKTMYEKKVADNKLSIQQKLSKSAGVIFNLLAV